ncbi:MAG: hypothetical protein H7Z40_17590 [Phycisphaerae bacterium]|nr:hypothetical protein [Gemmatimonadaceae bacterium]
MNHPIHHGFEGAGLTSTRAFAHAKLNLVLRVLAREASGFHGIETLFQALELADVVDVTIAEHERTLHCDGPAMPSGGLGPQDDNLATRAAVAYAAAARWETGWNIAIDKNIPVGGGLGGGSADAAAVLRAFETLSPAPLGTSALMELAGTLGSDVPFLVSGAPLAWAWNRGDRLLPFTPLPRMEVVLATFVDGVNTGRAYAELAREAVSAVQYPTDAFGSWSSIVGLAHNDFESVVPSMHAGVAHWLGVVKQVARRMNAEGLPAIGLMSGSGATCFVLGAPGRIPELGSGAGMRAIKTHTLTTVATF